jgi:hypothetical protein
MLEAQHMGCRNTRLCIYMHIYTHHQTLKYHKDTTSHTTSDHYSPTPQQRQTCSICMERDAACLNFPRMEKVA